jgi:hypothetical protein
MEKALRICFKCKLEKKHSEFTKDLSEKDGFSDFCKDCSKIYRFKQRQKNLDRERLRGRKSYYKNKTKNYLKHVEWRNKNLNKVSGYNNKWYHKNKDKVKESIRNRNKKLLEEIFDHYGHKCSIIKCGSLNNLRVDHIGGCKKDKYLKGHNLWRWLKKNNFPSGYRILCTRCNTLDGYLRSSPFNINGIDELIRLVDKKDYE